MDCKEALPLIHEYLDDDLEAERALALKQHLHDCSDCSALLRQYEQVEALARVLEKPRAPSGLTASIMASLPPERSSRSWSRWIRRHPAATAAAAFLFVMISSFLSLWNQGTQLAVRGDDLEGNIIIEEGRVIVPPDATVRGDLIVENGTVQVDGELEGNLTVIDGNVALASASHISGRITEVDRALDYIWYKLGEWFGAMLPAPQT
ncbi:zf-HC2 domain-containing protein [Paenibacillus sp.]|uniref:zf-HC2 domain-containing protein n=1 Tax=Paenibacillus sp. TaxID=58172 RepID=UPI002D58FA48|nr:zf-HC2 domain-containing protein [Paenibacillus sp.]HZG86067.1 zf-HC2 domain-containing protein [Paenibacillus sp.]